MGSLSPTDGEEVLQLSGSYILPGFLDTHIHGAFGQGINCSDANGLAKMASRNPVQTLGISHICGSIQPGKLADLVILDSDYRVTHTYINGRCVFAAE